MTSGRTLLVTGAARSLGAAVLRDLVEHGQDHHVIAVDLTDPEPRHAVDGVEHVRLDLRAPAIATLIAKTRPDTVLHLDVLAAPGQAGGRTAMKERNVIGTMQLLAACQRAPSVRRLVVKSSAAVYGCAPRDPAHFTEDTQPHRPPHAGYGKDCVEVEEYVRGFARRRTDVAVTVLRFAGYLGTGVDSLFADYFALPVLPAIAGYDPRLQFVHVQDVVRALRLAASGDRPGVYNVAGAGSLTLSQLARRLGRATAPLPGFLAPYLGRALRQVGVADFTGDQLAQLTYGRVLDLTRMTERFGFTPAYTTAQAVAEHARTAGIRPLIPPDLVRGAEQRLIGVLERHGQERASRQERARAGGDGRG
jgi:UDP-glucose 4-epimerase